MVALRAERAQLLGYDNFAQYRLDDAMAKTPQAVRGLLERVWAPAIARTKTDRDAMQELVRAEGGNFLLAAWDWRYYAEKLRKAHFDLDEAEIKPYFALDNIIAAAFSCAQKLFGLQVTARTDIPVWHPGRPDLGHQRGRRPPSRGILRRLLCALVQAQRCHG